MVSLQTGKWEINLTTVVCFVFVYFGGRGGGGGLIIYYPTQQVIEISVIHS